MKNEMMIPMIHVVAKPRIGPVPVTRRRHRDERGEVGVEDGGESVAVTVGKGLLQVLAGAQFFLRTLIDEHVGVDRHTEREHHTGQSAQRQCRLERSEYTEGEEEVEDERHVSDHARDYAIESAHEDHQEHKGYHASGETSWIDAAPRLGPTVSS